jgi:methylglyoxal/glyoxal reductase
MKNRIVTNGMTVKSCNVLLSNGVGMPAFGLGVWQTNEGKEVEEAVFWALKHGYRLIDTAAIYENETGCGNAIHAALSALKLARNDVFVTSKLWNQDIRNSQEQEAFQATLKKLKLEKLDLYLIHWPISGKLEQGWKQMESIYESGKSRAVGVSNYHIHHLKQIAKSSKLVPHVNQVECHPFLQQKDLRKYCEDNGIAFQAWSPLMQGNFKGIEALESIASKHKKTPSQVILRWNLQSNILTIPKSVREERIIENSKIFDFTLDPEDMKKIESLDCGKRFGPDPDNFNF